MYRDQECNELCPCWWRNLYAGERHWPPGAEQEELTAADHPARSSVTLPPLESWSGAE